MVGSQNIRQYEDFILSKETILDKLQTDIITFQTNLAAAQHSLDIINQSKVFFQGISEVARQVAKLKIEEVVTSSLQYVFGNTYSFIINLRMTASRPEAEFKVRNIIDGKVREITPSIGKGGGIVDILAVALKLAILELLGYGGFIWLDEPFKQLSEEFIVPAGRLLEFMATSFGRQIILITHDDTLAQLCNCSIVVTQENGQSQINVL